MKFFNLVFVFAFSLVLVSCDTLNQMTSLAQCKYELAGLANPTVAGINLTNVQGVNDLSATSLLKLTTGYMSGNLPLTATVNVQASNPNASLAQLEGLEWAIDLENKNMLSGMVDQRISVPANGGKAIIPVSVSLNLMEVLKGESKENILNLANSFLNLGESSSKVSIRVKPVMMIAGQKVSTGFVTLSHTVK